MFCRQNLTTNLGAYGKKRELAVQEMLTTRTGKRSHY